DDYNAPEEMMTFRNSMKHIDAVLFVSPVYNRLIPGVLKNAIVVCSRPPNSSIWSRKPVAIISQSPSNLSGFGATHHLRQSLVFLDMPILQQPEVYLAHSAELLDENGKIKNKDTIEFLQSF